MKHRRRAKPSSGASAAEPLAGSARRTEGNFSHFRGESAAATPCAPASPWLILAAAGLIVLAALAAYHNSLGGTFVSDDMDSIVNNRTIRQLWSIGEVFSPPPNGETVSGRPLLNLSLAINFALGGLDVRGYHVANLVIHIAAALLLFGILRRTFLLPVLRDRFGRAATWLALAGALWWTVHPLQTESVTYVVQRAESLAGFFYLLTLYCVIRGAGDEGARNLRSGVRSPSLATSRLSLWERELSWPTLFWYAAGVLACLLGMACKEVMVTAPAIVLLYDRTLLAGSFADAWRQRRGLYLGLAATWGLLAYLTLTTGLIVRQPEMGSPDVWSYIRSQPSVILHYLQLSIWPSPLCLIEEWPVANTLGEILPGAIVLGLLLAATLWGLLTRKAWSLLGAWFFLILAPTSSILPLGQLAYEHRMYLSLAAVGVLVVAGGYVLWDRLLPRPPASDQRAAIARWAAPVVVCAAVLTALGYATVIRNSDYRTLVAIWQDTVNKRPNSPAARNNLGNALAKAGRTAEAVEQQEQALRLKPDYAEALGNLGLALADLGRTDEAIQRYRQALRIKPDYAEIHNTLAAFLAHLGKTDEAIAHYQEAVRLKPDYPVAHSNLAYLLAGRGKIDEAIAHYQQALRLKPDFAEAHNNLGIVLASLGKTAEAIEHYQRALYLKVDYVEAHVNLGLALAALGRTAEAIEQYQQALRLQPDYPEAHNNLGLALAAARRWDEAIEHYRQVLRLRPDYAVTHYNLADALVATGKTAEAIEHYQQALRLQGDYFEAHNNLGNVLAAAGQFPQAIEHYEQALRLKPEFAEAHSNLAACLVRLGRTAEAIEHCQAALRLKPDYADAHYNLGLALDAAGRTDEAIQHYYEVFRLKPDYVKAHYQLANALASVGRTKDAIEHFNRLLQLMPDSLLALNNLAWLLATHEPAEGGDPARAVQLAERARELSRPENAQCLDTLAAAYAAAGRCGDAVAIAQRAIELAESAGQTALVQNIRSRLELYRAGRPYREAPRPAAQTAP